MWSAASASSDAGCRMASQCSLHGRSVTATGMKGGVFKEGCSLALDQGHTLTSTPENLNHRAPTSPPCSAHAGLQSGS